MFTRGNDDPRDRLFDWLVYEIESAWLGQYVPIPADKDHATQRMDVLWRILQHTFSDRITANVTECLLIVWPKENGRIAGDAESGKCFLSRSPKAIPTIKTGQDARDIVGAWLQPQGEHAAILDSADSQYRVLGCYFSFIDGRERSQLTHPSDFVETPVFRCSAETGEMEEWRPEGSSVTTLEGVFRDHPRAPGARYYQRMAIGFGCKTKETADVVSSYASRIIETLVISWSYELEEEYSKSEGSLRYARGITHELAQVTSFLAPPSQRVDSWIWDFSKFQDALAACSRDDRDTFASRALVIPHRAVYESNVAYIFLWTESKSVSTPFDEWGGADVSDVLKDKVVPWAVQAAFSRWFRRGNRNPDDFQAIEALHAEFCSTVTRNGLIRCEPGVLFPSEPSLGVITGLQGQERTTAIRRLIKLVTVAALNAIKHTTIDISAVADFYRFGISFERINDSNSGDSIYRFVFVNGCFSPPAEHELNDDMDGTATVLSVLRDLLQKAKITAIPRIGALPGVAVPPDVNEWVHVGTNHSCKTVVDFYSPAGFQESVDAMG